MEGIYPLTVTLTKKEAIMRKVKLIVHETYQGKRKSEAVFAAVFLSNAAALTPNTHSGITEHRGRFCVLTQDRPFAIIKLVM